MLDKRQSQFEVSGCYVYIHCGSHLKVVIQQKWKQFFKNPFIQH